jgi:hypothetical protein
VPPGAVVPGIEPAWMLWHLKQTTRAVPVASHCERSGVGFAYSVWLYSGSMATFTAAPCGPAIPAVEVWQSSQATVMCCIDSVLSAAAPYTLVRSQAVSPVLGGRAQT